MDVRIPGAGVRSLSVTVVVGVAALLVVCLFGARAGADPYPNCTYGHACIPDNYEHTYCFGASLAGDGLQGAAGYSMSNLVTQTRYSKTYMDPCSGNTDVVFKRNDSLSGLRGKYTCMEPLSGSSLVCLRARIEFNGTELENTLNKNKTACHELGHSGGLVHGDPDDCMISGTVYSGHIHYTDHHVTHMNQRN